jgi:hypothetical protein
MKWTESTGYAGIAATANTQSWTLRCSVGDFALTKQASSYWDLHRHHETGHDGFPAAYIKRIDSYIGFLSDEDAKAWAESIIFSPMQLLAKSLIDEKKDIR